MKQKTILAAILMIALAPVCSYAQVPGYLVMNDSANTAVKGSISWMGGSRIYQVRDPKNPTITRSVNFDQVREVRVAKPAGLDAAVRSVEGGNYSGPHISQLQGIVDKYEMLQHDLPAGAALARAYVETGKSTQAEEVYRKLKSSRGAGDLPGKLVSAYWDALLKQGKKNILTREIDIMLRTGSRGAVAVAYILKGDILKQDGKFEEALVDGYLRTAVLYRDIKDAQPEALFNAYECFQELNQVTHAEKMRQKLMDAYPRSSYTRKLQSGN